VTRLGHLLTKEVLQLRRDRRLFGILVVAPILQLLVLGYAARTDVREIDLAVRDLDRSQESRGYVSALSSSGYFTVSGLAGPESRDAERLVTGDAGLVLVIPEGFGGDLQRGRQSSVQVLVDG